jgi:hypothetical protein
MEITVVNKRATGGASVYCVDGIQVDPGESHVMTGRTAGELIFQQASSDDDVAVIAKLEGSDRAPIVCTMKDVADPEADATTSAGEGFDLLTEAGAAANVQPAMYLGAFDDADCTVPAGNATLNTASTGTIVSGGGSNLLKVTPDAAGEFACTLTDTVVETVYLRAWPVGTDYVVDSSDTTSTAFTES